MCLPNGLAGLLLCNPFVFGSAQSFFSALQTIRLGKSDVVKQGSLSHLFIILEPQL